ncbi:Lysine-specific demethylase 8 [Colletotrichum tanaceti]|uniref:Lysine-specific demethylase 8 n=1 Tax=Colletotrichum tanaceti TaxID=1306861 RepID=A0A4U6XHL6_9PEZI|nr:Lysine-specific demethylase 8 [Colletotrichum tanaceti]TKW55428.1 Lysine-specific demethylase 8 [Colletotrichum tanaceti]
MLTLDDPDFIQECVQITASIHTDARLDGASESHSQQKSVDDGKYGLKPLEPEILQTLENLALDVLTVHAPDDASAPRDGGARLLRRLDEEIERTYRRFYAFVYADLPYCWRQLYTDLSLLKFSYLVFLRGGSSGAVVDNDDDKLLDELVAVLDRALILAGGAGLTRGRRTMSRLLAHLDGENTLAPTQSAPRLPASFPTSRPFTPPVTRPIRVVDAMTMPAFQSYLDRASSSHGGLGPEPLVLKSLLTDWPALSARPWSSPEYLLSRTHAGRRLVPVEVGRSYVDEGWTQELIPFRDLLSRIIASSSSSPETQIEGETRGPATTTTTTTTTTYLAQHELFAQLPHLQNDILTPDHCFTSPPPHPLDRSADKSELALPLVNAWLGPAGTITPLHTDGYHNLLCQAVGAKYVRLYAPHDSEALCPRGVDCDGDEDGDGDEGTERKVDMSNTSAFDVGAAEGWDPDPEGRDAIELEEFRGLRHWDCVLEAGDALYIPIGWWHYVRGLSVSFSVSFWWNGDHCGGRGDPCGRSSESRKEC